MSDPKDEFKKEIGAEQDIENLKRDNSAKQAIISSKRLSAEMDRISQNELDLKAAKKINLGLLSEERIAEIQEYSTNYTNAARNPMAFICDEFKGAVPFFKNNLILIGSRSGGGKSTAVANIVTSTIKQINPQTGKRRRAIILSNEETADQVLARIVCHMNGWHYVNHDQLTNAQIKTINRGIQALSRTGLVTVIDDDHSGIRGLTSTPEGIETVFENLLENKEFYDVVLIDYFQGISESKVSPTLKPWENMEKFIHMSWKYAKIYSGPIVVMAQCKPPDKNETPFKERLEGRKTIYNKATVVLEMIPDWNSYKTQWVVHKSRNTAANGKSLYTGYDNGRFVDIDDAFKQKILNKLEAKNMAMFDKQNGIRMEEEEENHE